LLDYVVPDHVHVLAGGQVVRSGNRSLAVELEERGYGWIENPTADAVRAEAG
jgi:Fe-S cluster assembly ATP-binding protein